MVAFESNVFINCPFDKEYAPILQATLFAVVLLGFTPRLATERSDGGENRLEKIRQLIEGSQYSIHDLSRCQARKKGEFFRLNMPFELGIDWGCRQYYGHGRAEKRFLILEERPYRYQAALSDISGCDIETHSGRYDVAMTRVRNWLKQQTGCNAPGPSGLIQKYVSFSEWEYETLLGEGYSKDDIEEYPTFERLEMMTRWIASGQPDTVT